MYVPLSAPINTASQQFVFGRAGSGVEAIAPDVEGETVEGVGVGDSDRDGDDNSEDGIASGRTVDSMRVEGVQLAGESQHAQHHTSRTNDLPRSSGPPMQSAECPNGAIKCRS